MSFYNGILNHDDIHESGQIGQRGLPGIGFKLDANGDFNLDNKKLTNIKYGDMDHDAMTKSQIEYYVSDKTKYLDGVNPGQVINNKAVIYSPSGGVYTNDLYLKDQYDQEVHFFTEDQDDNQIRIYIPNLKNNDSFGGRLKSSLVITSIDQTIEGKKVFHNIEVPTPTKNNQASNKAYIDANFVAKSGDTMTGSIVVPKDVYPIQGNLNKVISYEAQREIFLSKKEGGKMEQAIDMNGNSIDNLKLPTDVDQATTKGYVDNNFLNRLTGGQIGGDLDMRGHSIKYLKLDKSDSAAARVAELNLKADKIYVDSEISKIDLSGHINAWVLALNLKADKSTLNDYLKLDGSRAMTYNLNMSNNKITNVKTPLNDSDAVNKGYLDNHSIQPAHPQKNALAYIMDDVNQTSSEYGIEVDKIDDFNDSFHSYNKKVIYLKLLKDGNNYRSRIGYNIFKLIDKSKDRYYTAVIEWLTTDNNVWNKMEIFNNITSGSIILNQTRKFEDGKGLYYTRSIIQFKVMAISTPPLYLLSTIHIDGVNPTYPAKFSEVYNIIYGTNGIHTTISPIVFDYHNTYEIKNNKMKMNVDLDMNNMAITNIKTPVNNSDAVTKKYTDDSIKPFENAFDIDNNRIKISKQLDMNNKSITNVPMSIGGHILIYGLVNQYKNFTTSNIVLKFRQIHIGFIRLFVNISTLGKSDVLKILNPVGNETRYCFIFPRVNGYTQINIDRYFSSINNIQLTNTANIGFQIGYMLFR